RLTAVCECFVYFGFKRTRDLCLILVFFFYRSLRVVSATRFLKERWWWLERLKEQAFHSDLDIKKR
ncbi:hypothetical protein, partial [Enterococcus casseliflavus]|uniref:hypothetical protein n=1 Tax=Enterococcus casseliflavus TaxID=37734 RepID=UPI0022E3B254